MEPTEKSPLLNHTPTASINRPGGTQLYLRRWYMLFVFSALALLQSMTWNTWGPIADTGKIDKFFGTTVFALTVKKCHCFIVKVCINFFFKFVLAVNHVLDLACCGN